MNSTTLPGKILVVLPNYIGDILMSTPALRLLRINCLNAEICVVTTGAGKELLDGNSDIDRIITRRLRPALTDRFKLVKEVKKYNPDMVFLFRTTFFNSLLTYLSGARTRVGTTSDGAGFFLTHRISSLPERKFRDEYIRLVDGIFTAGNTEYSRRLKISFEDTAAPLNLPGRYAVVMAGTTRHSKKWPPVKFARLVEFIKGKHNIEAVLTGSPADLTTVNEILQITDKKPINLAGKTNLKQLIHTIKHSDFFIGPDTGALYISEAAGTPAVALFGSTFPDDYSPFPDYVKIVYKNFPCSPCNKQFCPKVKRNQYSPCMDAIEVEEVMDEINRLF
jgi:lipopolysaccharide heptosyltransferase II